MPKSMEKISTDGRLFEVVTASSPLMLFSTCPTRKLHQTMKASSHVR